MVAIMKGRFQATVLIIVMSALVRNIKNNYTSCQKSFNRFVLVKKLIHNNVSIAFAALLRAQFAGRD